MAKNCKGLGYPDDMLVGAVIGMQRRVDPSSSHHHVMPIIFCSILGAVLGFKLTNELAINSNLNGMRRLSGAMLKQQVWL